MRQDLRRVARRTGAMLLLLVWAPVATGNTLTCALSCARLAQAEASAAHGAHHGHQASDHAAGGHHGRAVHAQGTCDLVQPSGALMLSPEAPSAPTGIAQAITTVMPAVVPFIGYSPSFDTPPPRV